MIQVHRQYLNDLCCLGTGAPKLINNDLFLEKRVFIGTVARFSRNKSLLISFGAPVV